MLVWSTPRLEVTCLPTNAATNTHTADCLPSRNHFTWQHKAENTEMYGMVIEKSTKTSLETLATTQNRR